MWATVASLGTNLKTRRGWCWSRTTFSPFCSTSRTFLAPKMSVKGWPFQWWMQCLRGPERRSRLLCRLHSQKHVTKEDSRLKRLNLGDADVIPGTPEHRVPPSSPNPLPRQTLHLRQLKVIICGRDWKECRVRWRRSNVENVFVKQTSACGRVPLEMSCVVYLRLYWSSKVLQGLREQQSSHLASLWGQTARKKVPFGPSKPARLLSVRWPKTSIKGVKLPGALQMAGVDKYSVAGSDCKSHWRQS